MADAIVADVNSSGIYQIRNVVNGKRYIGSAKCFRSRWNQHRSALNRGKHSSRHLQNSWRKRGADGFVFEIIELCPVDELLSKEQAWLDIARPEYNCSPTAASPLGVRHGREFRDRVSARFRGKKHTPEHISRNREASIRSWNDPEIRARRVAALRESYDADLRLVRSEQSSSRWKDSAYREEMRQKIARSHDADRKALTSRQSKARWSGPAYRASMVSGMQGRRVSEGAKEKIRRALIGKQLSVETRQKKSRLSDDQVREMRRQRLAGAKHSDLAKQFGVHEITVSRILQRRRYEWVV